MEVRQLQVIPDAFPSGDVRQQDAILVVGNPPSGLLVYRAAAWVHELQVGKDMVSRVRAAALVDAAMKRDGSRCALFLVGEKNKSMQQFVEELGAIKQSDPGDVLYTLTV